MRPSPGDVIGGKYRILRVIGDGGMGVVYEARHEVLGSPVALKFLHAELTRRPGLASRFLQEARVSASIQSPHVTRVTDVDQTPDGAPYLVMELLTGESLQQLLDRKTKLARDQALDFALQILSGLDAAHALGVVHRDLKPDNVFVTPSSGGPVLKLLDFGIAKLRESSEYQKGLTRPGAVMGTPEYMAPEQLYSADKVDHRADIYSLGSMLYEMLTGARPAYGDDAPEIVAQVALGKVKPIREHNPSLPEGLAKVVHKAIAAERDQRFSSAQEFRLALAPFAGELSHAGRLAATPAPGAVTGSTTPGMPPPAPSSINRVEDVSRAPPAPEEDLRPSTGGVAPTLPPDADPEEPAPSLPSPPLPGKGATQEAPREEIQRSILKSIANASPAPTPAPYVARPQYVVPPAPPTMTPRRSVGGALAALILGVLVAGGVIAAIVLTRGDDEDELPLPPLENPPGTVTISAQDTSQSSSEPPPPLDAPPLATPRSTTVRVPRRDAGEASPDSGIPPFTLPPLPSTLPSSLPPLPSTLPPLPSGFPQFPFPFPQPTPEK